MGEDGQPMSRNRRHRTMRQQMLNKQAQQRYRCRCCSVPPPPPPNPPGSHVTGDEQAAEARLEPN